MRLKELRLCRAPDCNNYFKPSRNHIYCGSAKKKIGCSYKNRLELNKRYVESRRKYLKKWWQLNKEKIKAIRNPYRRTPEYHQKVKQYKFNKNYKPKFNIAWAINNYHVKEG